MDEKSSLVLEGNFSHYYSGKIVRFLMGITGISFLKAIILFFLRYVIGFKRKCFLFSDEKNYLIEVRIFLLGFELKKTKFFIPRESIVTIRIDESLSFLPILGIAGGLITGLLLGFIFLVEWSLTLFGRYIILCFLCILFGIGVEIAFGVLIPRFKKKRSVQLITKTHTYRISGVDEKKLDLFVESFKNFQAI